MKCPNCFNEIDRNLSECPYCGNVNLNTMKLPVLKKVDKEENSDDINNDLVSFLEEKGLEHHFDTNNDSFDNPFSEENDNVHNNFVQEEDYKGDDIPSLDNNVSEKVDINPFDEIEDNVSEEKHFVQEDDYSDGNVSNNKEVILGKDNGIVLDEEQSLKEAEIIKEAEEEKDFEMKLPFRKRIISILLIAIALFFIAFLIYSMVTGKGEDYSKFSVTQVEVSLNDYYKQSNDSKLEDVLSKIENEEQLKEAQEKTKEVITGWINDNLHKDFKTETDLNTTVDKYRTILNEIYNYKSKNNSYCLLSQVDYTDLLNTVEKVKNGSGTYFKAENLYKQKSYNDAYRELSKISSTNKSFNDAKELKKKIVDEILELLKADIEKVKATADNEEIKALFATYVELYSNVPLTTDADYVALYNQYK